MMIGWTYGNWRTGAALGGTGKWWPHVVSRRHVQTGEYRHS